MTRYLKEGNVTLYIVEGCYYGKWLPITKAPVPFADATIKALRIKWAREDLKLEERPTRLVPVREEEAPVI